MARKKGAPLKNPKQEEFCRLYATSKAFYANGTKSYLRAYYGKYFAQHAKHGTKEYAASMANAYKLLRKTHILNRITECLEANGLNDAFVDKELLHLIRQEENMNVKLGAIKEFNVLQGRITKKVEIAEDVTEDAKEFMKVNRLALEDDDVPEDKEGDK